jgi:hypothetical protein
MLSNGPRLACSFPGEHRGNLHEYEVNMIATLDARPVSGAPVEKTYICEGHYPDSEDPTFSKCMCSLCLERKRIGKRC